LASLIELAAYTGARLEEICSLRVQDVDLKGGWFRITEAKTESGRRVIPIHSNLAPTMARLVAASADGYVLSGEIPDQYGRRSGRLGKRFAALRTSLEFGSELVFHSIRKTVATSLSQAGVADGTIEALIGHAPATLLRRTYASPATLEMKRLAIEKLAYPEP
jgi:integrase